MAELEDPIARIRGAWMAGRPGAEHMPGAWRAAVGEGPGTEAALAALTGQALQVLFRPTAPPLTVRTLLPVLGAPTAPEASRGRIRRLLVARRQDEGGARLLVQLLAARGYVMHPADWLPKAVDDWAPAAYAPWLAWAASEAASAPVEALTAENWGDWPWAERRAALVALRRCDPEGARALIAAKAGGETAERRLKLLQVLEQGLSAEDAPVLEAFKADRSDRVKAVIRQFQARLGRGEEDAAAAQELGAMVDLARIGLIKRRHQLQFKPLKTKAQEGRRQALLGEVTLAGLARALGVDEAALVESLPVGEPMILGLFMTLVEETASPTPWRALYDLALREEETPIELVAILGGRASPQERAGVLAEILARDPSPGFRDSLAFAGEALGAGGARLLTRSAGYKTLMVLLAGKGSDEAAARASPMGEGLAALGLLLDQAGARMVVDACLTAGLSVADPRLDLLHLNLALEPESPL